MNVLSRYNRSIDPDVMPERIRRLPISPNGWPVPWFVTWFDGDKPCTTGHGVPDFRVADTTKMGAAIKQSRCWICGGLLGTFKAFVIGPMCAITRTISEPPSHRDCATYAAKICPFLANPRMRRNEKDIYDSEGKLAPGLVEAAGDGLKRNPGAVCVWITREFTPFRAPGGILFSLGKPVEISWFAEGRDATRAEVLASIDSGYPSLEEIARAEGNGADEALSTKRAFAMALLPDE